MTDRALAPREGSASSAPQPSLLREGGQGWLVRFGPRAWLLGLIRLYQLLLSPMLGPRCRFYPSCSHYAAEALRTHGVARGSMLAARRVCRCHPFHPGGYDPVPGGGPIAGAESAIAEGRAT